MGMNKWHHVKVTDVRDSVSRLDGSNMVTVNLPDGDPERVVCQTDNDMVHVILEY